MVFCRHLLASRRSRLGALDAACESEPVLASADYLAAALKAWQCFTRIAGVCDHRVASGRVINSKSMSPPSAHTSSERRRSCSGCARCPALSGEPAQPREVMRHTQLVSAESFHTLTGTRKRWKPKSWTRFARRRSIITADNFYEWRLGTIGSRSWFIAPTVGYSFAGVYESYDPEPGPVVANFDHHYDPCLLGSLNPLRRP